MHSLDLLLNWDIYYYCTETRNKLLSKSRSELKKLYEKEYSEWEKFMLTKDQNGR